MPDYLTITGDASDNIEGIEGLGDKRAKKLLAKFSNLEEIFEGLNDFPDKKIVNQLKAADPEKAIWTRDNIIKLKDDIFDDDENFLNECLYFFPDNERAEEFAAKLGLKRVLKHLNSNLEIKFQPEIGHEDNKFEIPKYEIFTRDYKAELRTSPDK